MFIPENKKHIKSWLFDIIVYLFLCSTTTFHIHTFTLRFVVGSFFCCSIPWPVYSPGPKGFCLFRLRSPSVWFTTLWWASSALTISILVLHPLKICLLFDIWTFLCYVLNDKDGKIPDCQYNVPHQRLLREFPIVDCYLRCGQRARKGKWKKPTHIYNMLRVLLRTSVGVHLLM